MLTLHIAHFCKTKILRVVLAVTLGILDSELCKCVQYIHLVSSEDHSNGGASYLWLMVLKNVSTLSSSSCVISD